MCELPPHVLWKGWRRYNLVSYTTSSRFRSTLNDNPASENCHTTFRRVTEVHGEQDFADMRSHNQDGDTSEMGLPGIKEESNRELQAEIQHFRRVRLLCRRREATVFKYFSRGWHIACQGEAPHHSGPGFWRHEREIHGMYQHELNPRNHILYRAHPGKDGLFRCPFANSSGCAHMPTKQKCGYE